MSALAHYLREWGCLVSGCDARESAVLDELRANHIDVVCGHDDSHVSNVDVVLWSPAVRENHGELDAARVAGCELLPRRRLLAALADGRDVLAVTGTHGKTTATSMLAHVLASAGPASWIVGADVRGLGRSGHFGGGPLALELDESYGAFTEITPAGLVVLNVDVDHLDYYGDVAHLRAAFADVVERTRGPVVVYQPDEGARAVADSVSRPLIRVGPPGSGCDVELERVSSGPFRVSGTLTSPWGSLDIGLGVAGNHSFLDAALVATLALAHGVANDTVTEGLSAFRGAPRRFERVGRWRDADVVIDYAHLPAEIASTLSTAWTSGYQLPVVVFQPHRYTRTLEVGEDFAPAFDGVELVIVTDIYSAGEINSSGVTGEYVAEALRRRGRVPRVVYAPELSDAARAVEENGPGDLLLLVGAGDVPDVATLLGVSR